VKRAQRFRGGGGSPTCASLESAGIFGDVGVPKLSLRKLRTSLEKTELTIKVDGFQLH